MSALRRLLSGATTGHSPGGGDHTGPSPIGTPRLSTSMSFNDMSMGTAADAAELDTPSAIPSPAACLGRDGRRSLDSCLSSERSSLEASTFHVGSLPATGLGGGGAGTHSNAVRAVLWRTSTGSMPPAYGPTRTPAINIPPASSPAATKAALAAAALATGTPRQAAGGLSPPAGPTTPLAGGGPVHAAAGGHEDVSPGRRARAGGRGAASQPRGGGGGAAGKIDGLDYYEYVELIRASSL